MDIEDTIFTLIFRKVFILSTSSVTEPDSCTGSALKVNIREGPAHRKVIFIPAIGGLT